MATVVPTCPCEVRRAEEAHGHGRSSTLERMHMVSRLPSESPGNPFAAEELSVNLAQTSPLPRDSVRYQNSRYERLISGQESEIGEVPPAYSVNATSSVLAVVS